MAISTEEAPLSAGEVSIQLQALLYQLTVLCERFEEERQIFERQHRDQALAVEEWVKEVRALAATLNQRTEHNMHQVSDKIMQSIHTSTQTSLYTLMEKHMQQLGNIIATAGIFLNQCQLQVRKYWLGTFGVAVLAAVLASVLTTRWFLPHVSDWVNPRVLRTYHNGLWVERVWPKLPKKMQEQIEKISNNKAQSA